MEVLVIVDVQNDFIDGALRNDEAIKRIPNIIEEINNFKGKYIFLTRDTHDKNYMNTMEGSRLPKEHCIKGTEGWQIKKEVMEAVLKKQKENKCKVRIINKKSFGYDKWSKVLKRLVKKYGKALSFKIFGFCTGICVDNQASGIKAAAPESNISIVERCCACVSDESHKNALEAMKMWHIDII